MTVSPPQHADDDKSDDHPAPPPTTKAADDESTYATSTVVERHDSNSNDAITLAFADGQVDAPTMVVSEDEDRRVRRKIDMVLMPLTIAAYTLQYIDRSAMSYAAVFTFREDLHLSLDEYSWLGSCYYIGYLFFEFPGSWILQRLPISKTMGVMIFAWGALLMAMAAPRNFAGMAALRTLLGATEALITPGFVLLVSRFYRRDEQPLRVGAWYCCNGLGSFIGGLLSYAMGHVHAGKLRPWGWIFMLNGIITILFSLVFLVFCPESPETFRGLSLHEKRIALERVRGNKSSLHSRTWKWDQFWEAVLPWRDPQGWWYFIIVLSLTIPNGGIANFLHLILQSYGYTAFQTILIGLPGAVMQIIFPLSASIISRRWPSMRCYCMMAFMLPALVGSIIQYKTQNSGARLFGYYIMTSYVATLGLCIAAPGANIAGYTKRVTVGAMIFIAYAAGNIVGPHLFNANESPPYRSGMLSCIVCFAVTIPLCGALRVYYAGENSRRDEVLAARGERYDPAEGDFADRTDVENISFRYAL